MAKFERSKGRKKDYKDSSPKKNYGSRRSFGDSPRGRRFSDRDSPRSGRDRRTEMTKVTCASCGDKCEVPFKPTSNKPVYCSDCFRKKEKGSSDRPFNKGLDIINEKLDKIMDALDIQ